MKGAASYSPGRIVMVGAFPPPVHGMAEVNAMVRERLQKVGAGPAVIDLAAESLERSLAARLTRLPKVVRGLGGLMATRQLRGATLYMSISGSLGQVYEILFLLLGRMRGMRIYLHHHSFTYLQRPTMIARLLTIVAGPNSVHITQSPGMAARLLAHYPAVSRAIPISNAVFLIGQRLRDSSPRPALKTLGFISNISVDKGVFEFLDLAGECEAYGIEIGAKLAGPFLDAETEQQVRKRQAGLRAVEYVGPQYGKDKESFYASIDVLIFATRYPNETEGIVNHEAMSRGIPVIAYGRGCIPEIIGAGAGFVIDPAEPFVPAAIAKIKEWIATPEAFQAASRAARECFEALYEENIGRWEEMMQEMLGREA